MTMPEATITLDGFLTVDAYAIFGGDDTAELNTWIDLFMPTIPPASNPGQYAMLAATPLGGRLSGTGIPGGYNIGTKFFEQTQVNLSDHGNNEIKLYDSPQDDLLVLDPNEHYGEFSTGDYSLSFGPYSTVQAYATGGGGEDTAVLHDSDGDDTFYAASTEGVLFGDEFYFRAKGFEHVRAISDSGGQDIARFYDSPADDTFEASSIEARMSGTPDTGSYDNVAEFFPDVQAYSRNNVDSSVDNATLLGSTGDDLFLGAMGWESFGRMTGEGYFTQVEGFGVTVGSGELGGTDHAKIWDSIDDDILLLSEETLTLMGNSVAINADYFDRVDIYASRSGRDTATLNGTPADEIFYGSPHESSLRRPGFYVRVVDFEEVYTSGGGGNDEGLLDDSAGDDRLTAEADWAQLADAALTDYLLKVTGFDQVTARRSDGDDTKDIVGDLAFTLLYEGSWQD